MNLIMILFVLVAVGALVWWLSRAPFVHPEFKPWIVWVGVGVALIYVLKATGLWGAMSNL